MKEQNKSMGVMSVNKCVNVKSVNEYAWVWVSLNECECVWMSENNCEGVWRIVNEWKWIQVMMIVMLLACFWRGQISTGIMSVYKIMNKCYGW